MYINTEFFQTYPLFLFLFFYLEIFLGQFLIFLIHITLTLKFSYLLLYFYVGIFHLVVKLIILLEYG